MTIAYPNLDGLGEWEPARKIMEGDYDWQDLNTNQIDVTFCINLVPRPKRFNNVVGWQRVQSWEEA